MRELDACMKPTVGIASMGPALVEGTGRDFERGDVVVATKSALFSIAEVRLGLHAGPIIPQLAAAIGPRQVRRYAVTG